MSSSNDVEIAAVKSRAERDAEGFANACKIIDSGVRSNRKVNAAAMKAGMEMANDAIFLPASAHPGVVPLVRAPAEGTEGAEGGGAVAGVLDGLDHFPDATDILRAAGALDAEVLDMESLLKEEGAIIEDVAEE